MIKRDVFRFDDGSMIAWSPRWFLNGNNVLSPVGKEGFDCLTIHLTEDRNGGTWADELCSNLHRYICEKDGV